MSEEKNHVFITMNLKPEESLMCLMGLVLEKLGVTTEEVQQACKRYKEELYFRSQVK